LDAYRPHGAYPEGPRYWIYGTHFQVVLLSVLQSALGERWGLELYPAFQESAVYVNQTIAPSGEGYNYGDGASGVFLMPALHWFANQAETSALDAHGRNILEGPVTEIAKRAKSERLFPLALLWLNPDLEMTEAEPLPIHWRADGP